MCKSILRFSLLILAGFVGSACNDSSPTQPSPPACTYTLSKSSLSSAAAGGSDSVAVTTAAQCTWSASSDRGWLSITSGASGTGPGTVTVNLSENTATSPRTGTLTIAGIAVAVTQAAAAAQQCSYTLDPTTATWGADGGSRTFAVVTTSPCAWAARSNASWIRVTGGLQGSGNGTVSYTVEPNAAASARTGTITAADLTFTISQAGAALNCEYAVSPVRFDPCMSVGYEMTATVSAPQGCSWTAAPDASWITLTSPASGNGSGVVSFRVSENWELPRQGNVMVRWPTPTAGQNVQVAQAGCRYAVSATSIGIAAAGGTGRFDVIQQSDPYTCGGPLQDACLWTAEADVPWITITSSMPRRGDDPVNFTVAANTGPARSGTIRVRDQVVVVNQAGQ